MALAGGGRRRGRLTGTQNTALGSRPLAQYGSPAATALLASVELMDLRLRPGGWVDCTGEAMNKSKYKGPVRP